MRAYNMSMAFIFINCGFPIAVTMGAFGSIQEHTGFYHSLTWLANPIFSIGPITISGQHAVIGIALIMLTGTALFLNSRAFSAEGVAYVTFAGIFWISFGTSSSIILSLCDDFPGLNILWTILLLAAALIFIMTLIQMSTGGQKANV